jgi:putative tricarboxylic transport membrane protein
MSDPETAAQDASLRKAGADFVVGLVIFVISLYALIASIRMPYFGDAGALSSPGLTPGLIALFMLVLSAVLMLRSRRFRLPFTLTTPSIETRRVLTVFGLVFLYVLLMPWIGYAVATFLMLFAFQTIFTARRDLRFLLIWAGGLSLALTAALYYVFGHIFLIPLP